MPHNTQLSQSARPEVASESNEKSAGWSQTDPASVSLISKTKKSGIASEKTSLDEPSCNGAGELAFIKSAGAMELRRSYKAEATAHRNMLARRKGGKIVHPELKSFRTFLLLVGPMPGKGMTLDRINNDDPEYAPGKVRWADRETQNNNKSDTLTFYYSRTKDVYTTSRLAKLQNVSVDAIRKRRRDGWSDDEIIEGKRSTSLPQSQPAKGAISAPAPTSKFPPGLYTDRQLAVLARSEARLTLAVDIQFHRNAHSHQSHREECGQEAIILNYEELLEFLEDFPHGVTREGYKRHVQRWWRTARPHVVYRNLTPDQKEMLAECDPEWVAVQEAEEQAAQGLRESL